MNRKKLMCTFLVLLVLSVASAAQAQATRTWVSGVGDDVNPCSRTAPCKTYAGAISKTATNGIISTLDPGGFGAVTITKSITIDGSEQIAGILAAGTTGVIINAAAGIVKLRGLEITGVLTGIDGIRILAASEVTIENCRIHSFTNDGIKVANTTGTTNVAIRGADISNSLRGVEVIPTAGSVALVSIFDSAISTNTNSGVDLVSANSSLAVFKSALTHNFGSGVQVQNSTSTAFVENSLVAYNGTGITSGSGAVVRLGHNAVVGNGNGIAGAGTVVGFTSNMVVGNGGGNTLSSSVASQ